MYYNIGKIYTDDKIENYYKKSYVFDIKSFFELKFMFYSIINLKFIINLITYRPIKSKFRILIAVSYIFIFILKGPIF